jgi:hypothetical protein
MATNTYVALDKVTVGTATSTVTFSSIPSGYTDLVIVFSGNTSAIANSFMRFNSDTGSNYSMTWMAGTGSAAASGRETSQTRLLIDVYGYANPSNITNKIINVQNYSNATTFKSVFGRANNSAAGTDALVGLWRSTSAITQIDILTLSATTFSVGSTFSLYGIRAEGVSPAAKATGGAIYSDSTYYDHVFDATGTFTPTQSLTADYLVIAGGGGGGNFRGGGGGAGGLRSSIGTTGGGGTLESALSLTATGYSVTVGAGGAGGNADNGSNGTNSVFSTITSTGGGGGAGQNANDGVKESGASGGSGGGSYKNTSGSIGNAAGGAGTANQGFAGGTAIESAFYAGSGGGGSASAGSNTSAESTGSAGGSGVLISSIWSATGTGVSGYYAGGGGGGSISVAGAGGSGGGGAGAISGAGTSAVANTGSGGGGGGNSGTPSANNGGKGAAGLVVIRYAK